MATTQNSPASRAALAPVMRLAQEFEERKQSLYDFANYVFEGNEPQAYTQPATRHDEIDNRDALAIINDYNRQIGLPENPYGPFANPYTEMKHAVYAVLTRKLGEWMTPSEVYDAVTAISSYLTSGTRSIRVADHIREADLARLGLRFEKRETGATAYRITKVEA